MGKTRLLSADPEAGRRTFVTETADGWTIHSRQDTSDVEAFAKWANSTVSDWNPTRWRGDMHHVARVPLSVVESKLGRMVGDRFVFHDEADIKRWLDDPDNRVWRTKPGSLSK